MFGFRAFGYLLFTVVLMSTIETCPDFRHLPYLTVWNLIQLRAIDNVRCYWHLPGLKFTPGLSVGVNGIWVRFGAGLCDTTNRFGGAVLAE